MSTQVLNDQTFELARVGPFAGARTAPRTMTYGGVDSFEGARPRSGKWFFLGDILLIALAFAAANNPKIIAR